MAVYFDKYHKTWNAVCDCCRGRVWTPEKRDGIREWMRRNGWTRERLGSHDRDMCPRCSEGYRKWRKDGDSA